MTGPMLKEEKGFTLVATLVGLVVLTILGLTIINVSGSNFRLTKLDSKSQSAYYIAEAGANYLLDQVNTEVNEKSELFETNAEFHQYLESVYANRTIVLDNFRKNGGEQPRAAITFERIGTDEETRDYRIRSVGQIGNIKRTVSSIISVTWSQTVIFDIVSELFFHGTAFNFQGSSITSSSGAIVINGLETGDLNPGSHLKVSNMYFKDSVKMDGGSASFGNEDAPGTIYVDGDLEFWGGGRTVHGDVRVNGNFRLKDAKMFGDVYVNGNLELGWTPQIHQNIYYTGNLIAPNYFNPDLLAKCIKVDSVESFVIPVFEYWLMEDSWYLANGYEIRGHETGTIPANAKWLVDSYYNTSGQNVQGEVIIISKGDITLHCGKQAGFNGALIAPNGRVEFSANGGTFNGVIISKDEVLLPQGGDEFIFMSMGEIFGDDIPIQSEIHAEGGGTSEGDPEIETSINFKIKRNIREE